MSKNALEEQIGGTHYKSMKIQPIEFAMANNLDACQHGVIKYVCRHQLKNGRQDLEKAKHYIDLMIEFYYGKEHLPETSRPTQILVNDVLP